jgi:hypothetical protein
MKRYLPMFLFLPVAFFLFVYSWAQGLLMGWFARKVEQKIGWALLRERRRAASGKFLNKVLK